jgi:hypothetical protein
MTVLTSPTLRSHRTSSERRRCIDTSGPASRPVRGQTPLPRNDAGAVVTVAGHGCHLPLENPHERDAGLGQDPPIEVERGARRGFRRWQPGQAGLCRRVGLTAVVLATRPSFAPLTSILTVIQVSEATALPRCWPNALLQQRSCRPPRVDNLAHGIGYHVSNSAGTPMAVQHRRPGCELRAIEVSSMPPSRRLHKDAYVGPHGYPCAERSSSSAAQARVSCARREPHLRNPGRRENSSEISQGAREGSTLATASGLE